MNTENISFLLLGCIIAIVPSIIFYMLYWASKKHKNIITESLVDKANTTINNLTDANIRIRELEQKIELLLSEKARLEGEISALKDLNKNISDQKDSLLVELEKRKSIIRNAFDELNRLSDVFEKVKEHGKHDKNFGLVKYKGYFFEDTDEFKGKQTFENYHKKILPSLAEKLKDYGR